jgi:capsular polysaccharide biosynthesis protein/Mrp family chromosome partitioning ATPase
MGVRDYVEVLRRQWATMLAVLLVSVLAGLALFLVAPSSYRSSVTFFMTGTLPGSDQLTAAQADELAQSRMPSYAAIVRSRSMAASVRQKLNLASPLTQVQHSISVRIPDKTVLLEVSVTAPTAKQAFDMASAIAKEFPRTVSSLEPSSVKVVEPAYRPGSPYAPALARYVVLSLLVGLVLAFVLAVGREAMSTRIRGLDDLRGAVTADEETEPLSPEPRIVRDDDLRGLLLALSSEQPRPRSISLVSAAARGTSASAAAQLALEAQALGWRTLLVDADLAHHGITSGLDLESAPGLTDLLGDATGVTAVALSDDDPVVLGVGTHAHDGRWRAPRPRLVPAVSAAAVDAPENDLEGLLKRLLEDFDLVIIDSGELAPHLDAVWSATHADIVLLAVAERRDRRTQVVQALGKMVDLHMGVAGLVLVRRGSAQAVRDGRG